MVCLLGYTVAVNYNTADFANTGETPSVCIWLAIINCVTGLASIATLSVMGVLTYQGIARNEIANQNRRSGKLEVSLIVGEKNVDSSERAVNGIAERLRRLIFFSCFSDFFLRDRTFV